MRIAVLQHTPGAGTGAMASWLGDHEVAHYRLFESAELPALDDFQLLILLGGSLSVHDEVKQPWMAAEKRLVHQALLARKRVFGTGLGAHMLAEALGARISACPQGARIGWWPLEKYAQSQRSPVGRMLPQRLMAMHWQHECCTLPHGAVPLYGVGVDDLQGFVWQERAIGLLCHLECDAAGVEQRLAEDGADLKTAGCVQDANSIRDDSHHACSANATLQRLLDYLSGAHAHMT